MGKFVSRIQGWMGSDVTAGKVTPITGSVWVREQATIPVAALAAPSDRHCPGEEPHIVAG